MSGAKPRKNIFVRAIRFAWNKSNQFVYASLIRLPYFHFIRNTQQRQAPCTFSLWLFQKVIGVNRKAYWPVHFTSKVVEPKNIIIGIDSNPGIEPGCYIQGIGGVDIGDNTQIAPNVGIISANHDLYDNNKHVRQPVEIGNDCWIGMNSIVLPGVCLGNFTVVAAGAVVTKSFEEGYCVLGGNPARKIKKLDRQLCVTGDTSNGYIGYLRSSDFKEFRKNNLWR